MLRKRCFLLYIIIVITLSLSGCHFDNYFPVRREMDRLEFIRVIGIDKIPGNEDCVRVTLLYLMDGSDDQEGEPKSGEAGGNADVHTIISEGETVLEAINNAQLYSQRYIFLPHISVAIIGEAAARDNLTQYADFVFRGLEARLSQSVYISKDYTAEDFIINSIKSDHPLPTIMKHLEEDYKLNSTSGNVKLIELMHWLDTEYTGVFIPSLTIVEGKSTKDIGKEKQLDVELDGYGIVDGDKLRHFANKELTTAINMVNNKYINGVIVIRDPTGKFMALDVIEMRAKKEYKLDGEDLMAVNFKLQVTANIGEQRSDQNVYNEEGMKFLDGQLEKAVEEYVERAIKFTQEEKIDVMEIGYGLHHRHPIKWEKIRDNWREVFPYIDIGVEVEGRISRTYDIKEPEALERGY